MTTEEKLQMLEIIKSKLIIKKYQGEEYILFNNIDDELKTKIINYIKGENEDAKK